MKKQIVALAVALTALVFLTIISCRSCPYKTCPEDFKKFEEAHKYNYEHTIRILSWNLQIFGKSEANNPASMKIITTLIKNFDVIFIQEIRDSSGTAFAKLCAEMPDYDCSISSRAGRTSMKEQYGCIYKKNVKLNSFKDFNPDSQNRWERPPAVWTFERNSYKFTVYVMHTKPDDTPKEIRNLESVVQDSGNVIVLGDLNADCNYYTNTGTDFKTWSWV